jgi:hypothetical protein
MMMSVEQSVGCLAGETEALGEKHAVVRLRPPQIPHGLTWAGSRVAAVGSRRLTT